MHKTNTGHRNKPTCHFTAAAKSSFHFECVSTALIKKKSLKDRKIISWQISLQGSNFEINSLFAFSQEFVQRVGVPVRILWGSNQNLTFGTEKIKAVHAH